MMREDHRNNSHNWNSVEVKPKSRSSIHISEFPTSPQQAFSWQCASVLTFHQLWSNRRLRTPQKWTYCSIWLGCVGSPWNWTTLIWKSVPQRTREISHVYRTPAVTRWRMSLRFWNIFCFLRVIVRRCIPKFARKVIVIPGLHMQKYF